MLVADARRSSAPLAFVLTLLVVVVGWAVTASACAVVELNGDEQVSTADDDGGSSNERSSSGSGNDRSSPSNDDAAGTGQPNIPCVDYATSISSIFKRRCVSCHQGSAPPQQLSLETYASILKGGLTGSEVIACQPTSSLLYMKVSMDPPPVGGRMPANGPPYLLPADIDAIRNWIESGARESCTEPDPCTDKIAPTFGGVTSATLSLSKVGASLCWSSASDNATATSDIVYDVFQATAKGAQVFGGPATASSAPNATCMDVEGLTPGQQYCFGVRARDRAGNRDANTNEQCLTVPTASCAEFSTVIQPILNTKCTHCHSGTTPPQSLHLDSYAGVMAGGLTGNEVIACKSATSLLYQKISMADPPVGVQMPADGPPYLTDVQIATIKQWIDEGARSSCSALNPCSDTTPPTFAGLSSAAVSATQLGVDLRWPAASDDLAPPSSIVYDIYGATASGGQSFSSPATATSAKGATSINIEGLTPGQTYCYVARARDTAGNRDANVIEKCVSMPAASCIDFNTMVKPIFTSRCTKCHSGTSPPQGLRLDSYAGVIAGGLTGNEVVSCQSGSSLLYNKISSATPKVGVRMPADGPPYLTPIETDTIKKWIDEGGRSSCAAPDPCSNTTPPTFGGLTSVSTINATAAKLCWGAASDDSTASSAIVYDVFEGGAPSGVNFTAPVASSAAGATCIDLDALSPQTQYCWVVRARDSAGNRDSNTVERCTTIPPVPPGCVDYVSMVQPLLNKNCVRCHSDPTPPQWLRLTSYEGVIAGGVRRNEIVACNPAASLIMSKVSSATPPTGKRMPYDGPPYLSSTQIGLLSQWIANGATRSCGVAAACGDTSAPTFAGVTSVSPIDATTVQVCWNAANDLPQGTRPEDMKYDVYESATAGGEAFSQPPQKTFVGRTCGNIRVGPGTNMCFVVRARDLANNRDGNTVERCATTPTPVNACALEYDSAIQPILSARCSFCHSGPSPGHFLRLTSYADLLAGGSLRNEVKACDWNNSLLHIKTSAAACGNRMPRDGAPWLAPSEDSILRAWVTAGARHSCSDPATCADTTPPTFGGVGSVQSTGPNKARVCWNPATDNATPSNAITYLVYEAATAGAEKLASPSSYAISGGETCIDVSVPFSSRSCYVVRARDLAFNTDANVVEICTTTPAANCFDYAAEIQPIFSARCTHCHGGSNPTKGISWESYTKATTTGGLEKLLEMVEKCEMPRDTTGQCSVKACLTPSQQRLLRQWRVGGNRQTCPW